MLAASNYYIDRPRITSPQGGDALKGVVTVTGSTNVPNFKSAEVDFAYDREGEPAWFVIQRSSKAVKDGDLAVWDTTTITDGIYQLRVEVLLEDGSRLDSVVSNLRVRNYTIVETPGPASNSQAKSPAARTSAPFTVTPKATSTRLPVNPAEVTPGGVYYSLLKGAGFGAVAIVFLGVYLSVRGTLARGKSIFGSGLFRKRGRNRRRENK
jgi:hypothetical protein